MTERWSRGSTQRERYTERDAVGWWGDRKGGTRWGNGGGEDRRDGTWKRVKKGEMERGNG